MKLARKSGIRMQRRISPIDAHGRTDGHLSQLFLNIHAINTYQTNIAQNRDTHNTARWSAYSIPCTLRRRYTVFAELRALMECFVGLPMLFLTL
jgi:hypothetical protein